MHRHQTFSSSKISSHFDVEETQLKCVFTFGFFRIPFQIIRASLIIKGKTILFCNGMSQTVQAAVLAGNRPFWELLQSTILPLNLER